MTAPISLSPFLHILLLSQETKTLTFHDSANQILYFEWAEFLQALLLRLQRNTKEKSLSLHM